MNNNVVKVIRSPIKVLWLDTGCIWKLDMSVWQKIAKLVLEEKIIVVDTGQLAEMRERYSNGLITLNDASRTKLGIYEAIVGEFIATDHSSFLSKEIKQAMEYYIKGESQLKYNFLDLFDGFMLDLIPLLDELNKIYQTKWGTARAFKTLSTDIITDWKALRQNAKSRKQTFEERRMEELLGMHEAIDNVSKSSNLIRKKNLLGHYLKRWKRASGNEDLDQILEFFKSEYYQTIPYVDVHSWLISDLIVGNEEPRSSDYFDVVMISMILPFADFMVVDGPMRNRIVNQVKLVKPKGQYDCKILLHSDLESGLDSIN
jgi:hypothetical protein